MSIDRERLAELIERERAAPGANFPGLRAAFAAAGGYLIGGVPMTWMRMWAGRVRSRTRASTASRPGTFPAPH